jgi:hypothetical protein
MCKKMFKQKRFAGRHLLTFESQKLNYFGKKGGSAFWHYNIIRIWAMSGILYTSLVSLIMTLICLDPCQWSLMSLITGNKVKKNTQAKVLWKRKGQRKSSILWTKKCTSDCKTLSVFERKIPLTLRVQISPRVKIMHNAWIFLPNFYGPLGFF